jgi:hypothetical protein
VRQGALPRAAEPSFAAKSADIVHLFRFAQPLPRRLLRRDRPNRQQVGGLLDIAVDEEHVGQHDDDNLPRWLHQTESTP